MDLREFLVILSGSLAIAIIISVPYGWWLDYRWRKSGKSAEYDASDSCM